MIKEKSANCILVKPNQIGTLTETLQAISMANLLILLPLFLTDQEILKIRLFLIWPRRQWPLN